MYFSSQSSSCCHSTPKKPSKARISKSMSSDGANAQYFKRLNSLEDEPIKFHKPREHRSHHRTVIKDRSDIGSNSIMERAHSLQGPIQMFQAFHSPTGEHIGGQVSHVPFNLTKGQYEYWMSIPHSPSIGIAQGYQLETQFAPPTLSAQLTKTFSSLVGGVCDLVTGTLNPSSMWSSTFNGDRKSREKNPPSKSLSSNLNPNAKCFTPLNPLAQEFHPSEPPPTIFMPDKLCEVMAASLSLPCTGKVEHSVPSTSAKTGGSCPESWSSVNGQIIGLSNTNKMEETVAQEVNANLNVSVNSESSEIDTTVNTTTNDVDKKDESGEEDGPDSCDGCRVRTFSGSSDDCFITFASPSQELESTSQECCDINIFVRNSSGSIDSPASNSDLKYRSKTNFFDDSDGSSEEDEDVDSESDSDWDEVDHSNDKFDEETLAMFADPIMAIGSGCKQEEKTPDPVKIDFSLTEEPHPQTASKDDISQILLNANATWNKNYQGINEMDAHKKTSVSIAPSESFIFIYEDPELSEALVEARKSDFPRRQADKQRMEMLMAPIFTEEHRQRVWERINGDIRHHECTNNGAV